jgi:hypothetical protein
MDILVGALIFMGQCAAVFGVVAGLVWVLYRAGK